MKYILFIFLIVSLQSFSQTPTTDINISKNEVVTAHNITWGWLNPLRGDKSPAAGKLWGDRTKNEPSGFLVKFNKGFSSPPHIHNVTYRGMVIKGKLHNDDPKAENMWLQPGSFWTQPAGEVHITAADVEENLAYIEIQEGPYLVKPTKEAFATNEKPINVDKSNLVWLNANDIKWISSKSDVKTAFLWGKHSKNKLRATLVKLPAGYKGNIKSLSNNFRAIVISGSLKQQFSKKENQNELTAGAYFGVAKNNKVYLMANSEETVLYIRSNGDYIVN